MSSNVEIDTGRQRPLPAFIEQPLAWLRSFSFNDTAVAEATPLSVGTAKP